VREPLGVALGILEEENERVGNERPARSSALGGERAAEPFPFFPHALDEFDGAGVTLDGILSGVSHLARPPSGNCPRIVETLVRKLGLGSQETSVCARRVTPRAQPLDRLDM
jgi:hypothetical protein